MPEGDEPVIGVEQLRAGHERQQPLVRPQAGGLGPAVGVDRGGVEYPDVVEVDGQVVVTGNGSERVTVQERANVTTTDTTALLDSIARVKNRETGYNVPGHLGTTTTVVNDGPAVGSCPNDNSTFDEGTFVEGEKIVISQGLFANGVFVPQVVA